MRLGAATGETEALGRSAVERASDRAFLLASGLLFAGSAALTIVWCASMSAMGMPMPGGWMMSMAWMRMPGQPWLDARAIGAGVVGAGLFLIVQAVELR
jgi:hypothetical protein